VRGYRLPLPRFSMGAGKPAFYEAVVSTQGESLHDYPNPLSGLLVLRLFVNFISPKAKPSPTPPATQSRRSVKNFRGVATAGPATELTALRSVLEVDDVLCSRRRAPANKDVAAYRECSVCLDTGGDMTVWAVLSKHQSHPRCGVARDSRSASGDRIAVSSRSQAELPSLTTDVENLSTC